MGKLQNKKKKIITSVFKKLQFNIFFFFLFIHCPIHTFLFFRLSTGTSDIVMCKLPPPIFQKFITTTSILIKYMNFLKLKTLLKLVFSLQQKWYLHLVTTYLSKQVTKSCLGITISCNMKLINFINGLKDPFHCNFIFGKSRSHWQ